MCTPTTGQTAPILKTEMELGLRVSFGLRGAHNLDCGCNTEMTEIVSWCVLMKN